MSLASAGIARVAFPGFSGAPEFACVVSFDVGLHGLLLVLTFGSSVGIVAQTRCVLPQIRFVVGFQIRFVANFQIRFVAGFQIRFPANGLGFAKARCGVGAVT